MKRRRHTPEQIVRKLAEGQKLLSQGKDLDESLGLVVNLGTTRSPVGVRPVSCDQASVPGNQGVRSRAEHPPRGLLGDEPGEEREKRTVGRPIGRAGNVASEYLDFLAHGEEFDLCGAIRTKEQENEAEESAGGEVDEGPQAAPCPSHDRTLSAMLSPCTRNRSLRGADRVFGHYTSSQAMAFRPPFKLTHPASSGRDVDH